MTMLTDLRTHSRKVFRELGLRQTDFKQLGVTPSESQILLSVIENPCSSLGDIAILINLDKSTTSRHVDGMVKKGWLRLETDQVDKRRRFLTATEEGGKLANTINAKAAEHVGSAMEHLSEEGQQAVLLGMKIYAEALEKARLKNGTKIEPICAEHERALTRMILQVLDEYDCNKPGFAAKDRELHRMYQTYRQDGYAYFVALMNDKVVGGIGIAPLQGEASAVCELRKMYILPEGRGIGLGKQLMDKALRAACELGYKKCYLETVSNMDAAVSLYEKYGFTRRDTPLGNTGHFGCDLYFERLLLGITFNK